MEMLVIAVIAILAFAAVLVPLFRRDNRGQDPREFETGNADYAESALPPMAAGPATPVAPVAPGEEAAPETRTDDIELEVQRYRAALRAGTICRKCGQANPANSVYCFDCGARLPHADEKEFE